MKFHRYLLVLAALLAAMTSLPACIPPNAQHTLTALASPPGSGTILVEPAQPVYPAGTVVTLEAVPAEGWIFLRWDAPGVNTTQQIVHIATFDDVTATALFTRFSDTVQPVVQDSGFEEGPQTAAWTQTSTNFETIICDIDTCEPVNNVGAHAGENWAAFGNAPDGTAETSMISQLIGMPVNAPVFLQFYVAIPAADANFILQVVLGDTVLLELGQENQPDFADYAPMLLDISQFAGMDPQLLSFNYHNGLTSEGQQIAVFLDDVILLAQGD